MRVLPIIANNTAERDRMLEILRVRLFPSPFLLIATRPDSPLIISLILDSQAPAVLVELVEQTRANIHGLLAQILYKEKQQRIDPYCNVRPQDRWKVILR